MFRFFSLLFGMTMICWLPLKAQHDLGGKVLDAEGQAIEGATVRILNSHLGDITDINGEFELLNVPAGAHTVKISTVGFATHTQTVEVTGALKLEVVLTEEVLALRPVVVTATKREVEAQRIPSTISVLDATAIADYQIDNINEVGRAVPNFRTYDDGGGIFPLVAVRGIATISDVPIVGIYVDDVPLFNTASFPSILNNIARIEVLSGPQGTLYGRNSLGGVINIVTHPPTNTVSGFASVEYGSFNQLQANAGINLPLIKDKLFVGLDGTYRQRDGYVTNTFLDQTELLGYNMEGGNIRLKWLMSDQWSLSLHTGIESRENRAYALAGGIGITGTQLDSLRENHPYELGYNTEGNYQTLQTNSALKLDYFGDKIFFKAITTAQTTALSVRNEEFDFTPFDLNESNSDRDILTFSEELRIGSNQSGSRLKWLAGLFAYRYQLDNRGNITSGADNALFAPTPDVAAIYPYIQRQNSVLTQTGISGYGNLDYALTPQLTVSAGLRYEWENSISDNQTNYSREGNENFTFPTLGLLPAAFEAEANFSALSPKLSASYQLSSDQMVFASVTRGYRPGGINAYTTSEENIAFDPEFTWNYEVGVKSQMLDNRLRLNLTGFYIDYTDQQLLNVVDITTFNIGTQNIGRSTSYGVELSMEALIVKGLQASVNVGYLETEIQEFTVISFAGEIDNSGNRNAFAPRWNGTVALTYSKQIGEIMLRAAADYQFQTEMFLDPENVYSQPAYGLLNARLTAQYKGLELGVWGQNLTDAVYFSYGYSLAGFGGFGSYGLPQTFGTSLAYRF
ncbi:MAG: TonB-dependent receptor [Bacteroidota bacterium]